MDDNLGYDYWYATVEVGAFYCLCHIGVRVLIDLLWFIR